MSEIDDIRRQMAQIRHDLHHDVSHVVGGVSEVVTEVSEVLDWRSVVRNNPFLVTGAALAIGYLVVPRRARTVVQDNCDRLVSAPAPGPDSGSRTKTKRLGPMSWALNLLWPIATQAAQSYAMIWIENRLKDHLHMGPDGRPGEQEQGHELPFRAPGQFR